MRQDNLENIITKISFIVAFLIPLSNRLVTPFIGLLLILTFFLPNYFSRLKSLFSNKAVLILVALYVLVFFAFFQGAKNILWEAEIKLSYLIFPIILATIKLDYKRVIKYFIDGVLISGIICVIAATYKYYISSELHSFFYQELSILHHPSYFAMFMNFALIIMVLDFSKSANKLSNCLKILFLVALTFMLGSKTGLITLILTVFGIIGFYGFNKKKIIVPALAIVVVLILGGSALNINLIKSRVLPLIEMLTGSSKVADNSTMLRITAWKSSINLIIQNPIIGVGAGNETDALNKEYAKYRDALAEKKSLNSHNQYLQIAVGQGIFGLLLFLAHLSLGLKQAIKNRNYYFLYFLLLFMINCLTESILQRQSGVVFYAFFFSLFALNFKPNDTIFPATGRSENN